MLGVEVPVERDFTQAQPDWQQLLGAGELPKKQSEGAVPQMALVRRQVEAAQLRPQSLEGPAEVAGMDTQVIDQAARVTTRRQ